MTRTAALIAALAILLTACGSGTYVHILRWDHIPYVGWRHMANGQQQAACFDFYTGDVLPACSGCYDANKRLIPGCVPGHYNVAPEKAALDAKIHAKRIEESCRRTSLNCQCNGLENPWTEKQKKVYPPCDPTKLEATR